MEPTVSSKPYRYEEAKRYLKDIIQDFLILSGDAPCPTDVTWQDIAGTLSTNLHTLALRIDQARRGIVSQGPIVFPSPSDLEEP